MDIMLCFHILFRSLKNVSFDKKVCDFFFLKKSKQCINILKYINKRQNV